MMSNEELDAALANHIRGNILVRELTPIIAQAKVANRYRDWILVERRIYERQAEDGDSDAKNKVREIDELLKGGA